MKIAVLSDIHDRSQSLDRMLSRLSPSQVDALICCGDIGSPAIIDQMARFTAPLHLCLGNCDQPHAQALLRMAHLRNARACQGAGTLSLPQGGEVAFVHHPEPARELALSGLYRAVFYGHTHRARSEHLGLLDGKQVLLANPGDIQGRYDDPRALVWDSEALSLQWVQA